MCSATRLEHLVKIAWNLHSYRRKAMLSLLFDLYIVFDWFNFDKVGGNPARVSDRRYKKKPAQGGLIAFVLRCHMYGKQAK